MGGEVRRGGGRSAVGDGKHHLTKVYMQFPGALGTRAELERDGRIVPDLLGESL
jgi:hypothetical protein